MSLAPGPDPAPPARTITLDLSGLPSAATATGVGLLAATVLISAIELRDDGHVRGSMLTVGLLAVIGLLAVAVLAGSRQRGLEDRASLASWPAATAFAGGGLLLAVLVDGDTTSVYLGSAVVLVLSLACYLVSRARAYLVTGLVALGLLYAAAYGDTFLSDPGKNSLMIAGVGAFVFVVGVTALGWLVPRDRAFIGVLTGSLLLWTLIGVVPAWPLILFTSASLEASLDEGEGGEPTFHNPFENDIYVLLALAAVLVGFWALCSASTGHVGFRVLIVALTLTAAAGAVFALGTHHPTRWAIGIGALGALSLLLAVLRAPGRTDLTTESPA